MNIVKFIVICFSLLFGFACSQATEETTKPSAQTVTRGGKPSTAPMTRTEGEISPDQQAILDKIAASLKEDTVEGHFSRGQMYLIAGEQDQVAGAFAEAVKDFSWILDQEPEHLGALKNRGMALVRSGQIELALKDMKAATVVSPKDDYSYIVYASLLAKTGQDKEAIVEYDKAIALQGEMVDAARFNRGNAHLREGNKELAQKDFEAVLESGDPRLVQGAKMNLESLK